jgi:hypothetical protein
VCVSVCGPAPLLGCRPIRVRVESIYCTHLLSIHQAIVHYSTWYQRIRFRVSSHPHSRLLPAQVQPPPAFAPPPQEAHPSLPGRPFSQPATATPSRRSRAPSGRLHPLLRSASSSSPSRRDRAQPRPDQPARFSPFSGGRASRPRPHRLDSATALTDCYCSTPDGAADARAKPPPWRASRCAAAPVARAARADPVARAARADPVARAARADPVARAARADPSSLGAASADQLPGPPTLDFPPAAAGCYCSSRHLLLPSSAPTPPPLLPRLRPRRLYPGSALRLVAAVLCPHPTRPSLGLLSATPAAGAPICRARHRQWRGASPRSPASPACAPPAARPPAPLSPPASPWRGHLPPPAAPPLRLRRRSRDPLPFSVAHICPDLTLQGPSPPASHSSAIGPPTRSCAMQLPSSRCPPHP